MPSFSGAVIDHSGTITTGGTAQALCPANPARGYLLVENLSTGDLWVNFGITAVVSQPSIKIVAGGSLVQEDDFVDTESVSIVGATTGQAFTCKEA